MSENSPKNGILKFDDYQESPFWIFIEFFPNLTCFDEPQSDDDPKELQEKKFQRVIQKKYNWRGSLETKIKAVSILSQDVHSQYNKAMQDKMEMEKIGYCSGIESTLLLIKFETLLNSIYSLCENLAFVGHILHPGIPRSFNEQRNKVKKYREKYPQYSEYFDIIEHLPWYELSHTMRSESTHYLPGFVFHSKNGLGILYKNMVHSNEKIEIENIQEYVNTLIKEIDKFLENYGKYHLEKFINEDHKTFHPCLIPHPSDKGFLAGGRVILLSEYLKKQPGKCINNFECPNRRFCPAFQKKVEQ